ncbi:MAG: M48 family metallopeptidase [Bryobacteraceae bacterium]|nr:M48 family metallopeptidase [Bryobacteraceae bacterium]
MQVHRDLHSALLFETPVQMYARVYRELQPRHAPPPIEIAFCRFANANSSIRMGCGRITVKISDLLEGAPAPVMEALAYILLAKLLRLPVDRKYNERFRRYLNRKEVRRSVHLVRQIRGRKLVKGPAGKHYDLVELFEDLNLRYFNGLMARPELGWSLRPSRTTLGHYDPSHNAIVISSLLDDARVPRFAAEYVLFHEMLHLRFPVEHRGARRSVHTREFLEAEKQFPGYREAKDLLRKL